MATRWRGVLAVARIEILGAAQLHCAAWPCSTSIRRTTSYGNKPRDLFERAVEHDVEVEGRTEDVADLAEHLRLPARVVSAVSSRVVSIAQRPEMPSALSRRFVVFAERIHRVAQHADRAEPALLSTAPGATSNERIVGTRPRVM